VEEHFIDRAIRYKKQLQKLGITQQKFADECGISQADVSKHLSILKLDNAIVKCIKKIS